MAGNDREPIGRKGKPTRPVKQKVSRRRYEDDDDYDDYDDYEDEEPMPRKGKGKGKGRKPRGKRGWLWLLLKLAIVFAVLIAIYGVYLDQKIRSRIDGKVWQLPAAVYGRMVNFYIFHLHLLHSSEVKILHINLAILGLWRPRFPVRGPA